MLYVDIREPAQVLASARSLGFQEADIGVSFVIQSDAERLRVARATFSSIPQTGADFVVLEGGLPRRFHVHYRTITSSLVRAQEKSAIILSPASWMTPFIVAYLARSYTSDAPDPEQIDRELAAMRRLMAVRGLGPVRLLALVSAFGSASAALYADESEVADIVPVRIWRNRR